MKTKLWLLIAVLIASVCSAPASAPPSINSFEPLVRQYEQITHPTMNPDYQVLLTPCTVPGLWNTLGISVFNAEYRNKDGTFFRKEIFLYYKGAVGYFTPSFSTFLSGVMKRNAFYYSYSYGSGLIRSHVGRLSIINNAIVLQETGGYVSKYLFVQKPIGGLITVCVSPLPKMSGSSGIRAVRFGFLKETATSIVIIGANRKEIAPGFPAVQRQVLFQ